MASTRTYSLLPEPIWFFVDQTGLPLGSGKMYTYSSLNPTQLKPVYQNASGTLAWPDPVNINLNGTGGPFYWLFDSATPDDLYNIFVYDDDNNLIWQVNNFSGGSGGGGGGTTVVNVQNQIVNNTFWNNIGTSVTPLPATLTVAPGTHDRFVSGTNTGGYTGPDITFAKNNTANTDQIIFTPFTLGSNDLSPDVTPLYYLKYTCGTALGESYKYIQIPVSTQNQNLCRTATTITIWARCNSGNNQLQLSWRQFFGDDSASAASPDVVTPISTLSLSSSWTKYTVSFNTPNPAGKTLGDCGNGGTFLQINYPLGAVTNIDFVKPSLYLGTAAPAAEFQVPDTIDAVVNTPRTGDVRTTLNSFVPFGWIPLDDGTIGSATSGSTTRANLDTFPLFSLIWNDVNVAYTPIYNSAGVLTTKGASAVADFGANKRLSLTLARGRVLGGTGQGAGLTNRVLGEDVGEEKHLQATAEVGVHSHGISPNSSWINNVGGGNGFVGGGTVQAESMTINNNQGSATPFNVMQPTTFMNFFIKL